MTHCCLVSLQIQQRWRTSKYSRAIPKSLRVIMTNVALHVARLRFRSLYDWVPSIHRLVLKCTFHSCSFVNEAAIKAANLLHGEHLSHGWPF